MSKPAPVKSEGARYERAAFRNYLRRKLKTEYGLENAILREVLNWVLSRQKRYDRKPGGL
jgi:hypothetical protein